MKTQVGNGRGQGNVWHAEKEDADGTIHVARFLGPLAEELADQWLRLKLPKPKV